MQPDAGHLHSLMYRSLVARARAARARESVRRANARVAPRLWLHGAICFAASLLLCYNTPALIGCAVLYALGYVAFYRSIAGERHSGPPPYAEQVSRSVARH